MTKLYFCNDTRTRNDSPWPETRFATFDHFLESSGELGYNVYGPYDVSCEGTNAPQA